MTKKKTKVCVYCNEDLPLSNFAKHSGYKDKHDIRCKSCMATRNKVIRELKKTAPPKPKACDCCGRKDKSLGLDHCSITNTFRGWICGNCNRGMGLLGDDVDGVNLALKYLKKKRKKHA